MPNYLEIAVAAPIATTLSYLLPQELEHESGTLVGRRALVPLGKRRITGYILAENLPQETLQKEGEKSFVIKKISSLLDDAPLFHPEMAPFFRWIASYYLYPLGLVIKAALPGGLTVKSGRQLEMIAEKDDLLAALKESEREKLEKWLAELLEKGKLSPAKTAALLQKNTAARQINRLQQAGLVACRQIMQKDTVGSRKERCFYMDSALVEFFRNDKEGGLLPLSASADELRPQIKLLKEKLEAERGIALGLAEVRTLATLASIIFSASSDIGEHPDIPAKELFQNYSGARKIVEGLVEQGLLRQYEKRIFRNPFGGLLFDGSKRFQRPTQLSAQQENALAAITPAVYAEKYQAFLLYGITGAGKTEVYLRAAEETLAQGRDVIVLVPEIALATQFEGQFVARFGDKVVLQHSGLGPAEKYDQYTLALSGDARVVIGARSAVFAPLKNPGLIIVDEEHDSSYKQDDSFRYNGRDLAVVRASLQNAVVLLGSATPAITSFAHAQSGKFTLLEMDQRIGDAILPKITLIDSGKEQRMLHGSLISEILLEKMQANFTAGYQTILLLNRRGFSNALLCVQCGTPVPCPHCSVSLTLHKHNRSLICHYCGFQQGIQTVCGQCKSEKLVPAGYGTERVEEEVAALLPDAVVRRIDSDIAGDRRRFHSLLGNMHERKIDILIGTQMIAKGHHFPFVTLVGVLWADGGMSMPDYKAAEKSFQLITQVTGRAGRGNLAGEVVIQTLRPEHYAIQYAQKHQYREFFTHEIELRKTPVFPPFIRLVLLRLQGKVESRVRDGGSTLANFCREWQHTNTIRMEILGPAPSPIDKVKDNFRYQILIKCAGVSPLHTLCQELLRKDREILPSGVTLSVDIDPENMM